MDTQRIVSELKSERNRLDKAIAVLDGASESRAMAGNANSPENRSSANEAPPSDGRRKEATIYVDEKAMGGAAKESFLR